ncbi:MAG: TlpA disulfide reductase family protein [Rubripirellula sp.]
MKIRLFFTSLLASALAMAATDSGLASAAELGIGSKAPAIDIEHWLQDGAGAFKPVTKFAADKVYVVEFWATWCGPCIGSMPHLAELQNKYRGEGVQIISVSDETVDEVKDLMGKEHPDAGKTFAEITSAYSLTTDPDRSVYEDYMDASKQQGIPTAFIVGKTGLIEWIGHPGNMDEPLEGVVNDSWDREAFKAEMKLQEALEENMQKMASLAGAGKFDEAIVVADEQIAASPNDMMKEHWTAVRHSLKLSSGKLDDETTAYYNAQIGEMKGDLDSLVRFGYSLYGVSQQGVDVSALAGTTIKALEAESESVADEAKPMYFNAIAVLSDANGDLDKAIKSQESAIEFADERQKPRLKPMLQEFKDKKSGKNKEEKADDAKE